MINNDNIFHIFNYKVIFDPLHSFSKNNNIFHVVDVLSYHEVIHTPPTTLHFWSSLSSTFVNFIKQDTNQVYKFMYINNILLVTLITFYCLSSAAQLHPRIHSIPTGTESVNGSRVDGGCKVNLVQNFFCGDGSESFLTDDHDPVINTTDRNWASQLVTVRKNNRTFKFEYDHVIMSFFFLSPVSLTSIKLSLFKCPQWRIGPPNLTVYVSTFVDGTFINPGNNFILLAQSQDDQSSCSGLVSVTIPLKTDTQYKFWYIVVSFKHQPDIDWVYVGEVQFYDGPLQQSASITSKPGISIYILLVKPNSQHYIR